MSREISRRSFVEESEEPLSEEQEKILAVILDLCYEGWIIYIEPDADPDGRERLYSFGNFRSTVRQALELE